MKSLSQSEFSRLRQEFLEKGSWRGVPIKAVKVEYPTGPFFEITVIDFNGVERDFIVTGP